jgi:hypothetical protein
MQVGTLMKARGTGRMFIIVEEVDILRKKRKITKKIKGYRVSPCDRVDTSFAVGHDEILQRFEVVS